MEDKIKTDRLEVKGMDVELQALIMVAGKAMLYKPSEIKDDPEFTALVQKSRSYINALLDKGIKVLSE